MASRLLSRLSRRIAGAARPIGPSPPRPLPSAGAIRPTLAESEVTRSSRMPFVANSTLQRFGYSSSALSQPTTGASQLSAQQGLTSGELAARLNYQKFSSSYTGYKKFLPYTLLFRWIEEIILDYVHHEVTRNMVMLYLRVFLIILMKDVFIDCYDLLTPEA